MMSTEFTSANSLPTCSETSHTWRLVMSLVIALGVHAVLFIVPVSRAPLISDVAPRIRYPLKIILVSSRNANAKPVSNTGHPSVPAGPEILERPNVKKSREVGAGRPSALSRPDVEMRGKSTPKSEISLKEGVKSLDIPVDSGAKSRSTVFDPKLEGRLAFERNKVRKFKSGDTEYMTTTGTFVKQGGRCWEVKQLIQGDTSSESSQWLGMKCPKASRSKSDIDRLAEKYGIP